MHAVEGSVGIAPFSRAKRRKSADDRLASPVMPLRVYTLARLPLDGKAAMPQGAAGGRAARLDREMGSAAENFRGVVSRTEQAMFMTSTASARRKLAGLRREVEALKPGPSPYTDSLLAMQLDLIEEYHSRHVDLHDADNPDGDSRDKFIGITVADIESLFGVMHGAACQGVLPCLNKSNAKWAEQRASQTGPAERRQRYAWSFASDQYLVDADGNLGAKYDAKKFLGLSWIESLPDWRSKLLILQGEGPVSEEAKEAYVRGSMQFAKKNGCKSALFVNVAADKLEFGDAVSNRSTGDTIDVEYISLPWPDGKRISPALIAQRAGRVADVLGRLSAPAALVVTCYGGLDRSGLTLAVTQLQLVNRAECYSYESEDLAREHIRFDVLEMLSNMKRARPRAITTPARAVLLFETADFILASTSNFEKAQVKPVGTSGRVVAQGARRAVGN